MRFRPKNAGRCSAQPAIPALKWRHRSSNGKLSAHGEPTSSGLTMEHLRSDMDGDSERATRR
jgi:hypothetical protein